MMQPQSHLLRYILIATLIIEATSCSETGTEWDPGQKKYLDKHTTPGGRLSTIAPPQEKKKKRVVPPPRSEHPNEKYRNKLGILDRLDTNIQEGLDARYLHNVLARTEPDQARKILLTLPDNPTKKDIKNVQSKLKNALGGVEKSGFLYGLWKTPTKDAKTAKKRLKELYKENQRLFNELAVKGYALALAQVNLKIIEGKEEKDEENHRAIKTLQDVLNAIFETDKFWARLRPLHYLNKENRLNIFINKALYVNDNAGFVRVEKEHEYGARWREWSKRDSLLAHQCSELYREIDTLVKSSLTLNVEEKNDSLLPGGYYLTEIKRLENKQKQLKTDLEELYEDTKKLSPQRSAS